MFAQRIRNTGGKEIDVEVRRVFPGHVIFRSGLQPKLHDFQTVQYATQVEPGRKTDLLYEIVRHQDRNAKQNSVALEEVAVNP